MKKIINTFVLVIFTYVSSILPAYSAQCTNDTWNKVMKRGKLVVGAKADYKPWGFKDSSGKIIGMEASLIAKSSAKETKTSKILYLLSPLKLKFLNFRLINLNLEFSK